MITAYLNLRRREERTRLSCLKIRSLFTESCTVCTGFAVSMGCLWVWPKLSGTRSREIRWIMFGVELKYEVTAIWKQGDLILWVSGGTLIRSLQPSYIFFWPKSPCNSLGEDSMNTQLRNDCDTPNKSWPWVSSEWLKITRKYKNRKQTFRLLEEVVRETKGQSVNSFLRAW